MGNIQSFLEYVVEQPPMRVVATSLGCGFTALWGLSLLTKNVAIIDTFWGLSFLGSALLYYFNKATVHGFPGRKNAVITLTALWATRLSTYLFWRNHGQPEDWRYSAIRKRAGPYFWIKSLFSVFLLQGAISFIISQPLYLAQAAEEPQAWTLLDGLGFLLFFIGFFFEAVSDYQLAKFKSNPANKGKLLTEGLWSLSRHPNYFGNAVLWWGLYFFSAAGGNWYSIFSPIIMTFLLMKVSGVPLLESSLSKRKPGYETYIKNTSAFFPWFKKT